jgi:hypothetical protein
MIGGMKRGLFGKAVTMPGAITGFGGGTFDMDGAQVTPSMPQDETVSHTPEMQRLLGSVQLPKEGPDWKGALMQALGGAADGAGQFFGNAPIFALQQAAQQRALQERAQMAAQAQMKQAERIAGLEDFTFKERFKAANPAPNEFERALQMGGIDPASEQGQALARQRATRLAEGQQEPRMVTLPDGRAFFGTMDEIQRMIGGGGQAQQVLGQSLPQGWQIEGGTSGNAGGNFRP